MTFPEFSEKEAVIEMKEIPETDCYHAHSLIFHSANVYWVLPDTLPVGAFLSALGVAVDISEQTPYSRAGEFGQ